MREDAGIERALRRCSISNCPHTVQGAGRDGSGNRRLARTEPASRTESFTHMCWRAASRAMLGLPAIGEGRQSIFEGVGGKQSGRRLENPGGKGPLFPPSPVRRRLELLDDLAQLRRRAQWIASRLIVRFGAT